MANAVKYWNGSSWQSSAWFGQPKMWDGSQWRMVEFKYAGASGTSSWNLPYGTIDAQTITVGSTSYVDYELGYGYTYTGYWSGNFGSISDGTSNVYGGATIQTIYHSYDSIYGNAFVLEIIGSSTTIVNSGWSTMNVSGLSLSRSSAVYTHFASGGPGSPPYGQWVWFEPAYNPFPGSGQNSNVYWS